MHFDPWLEEGEPGQVVLRQVVGVVHLEEVGEEVVEASFVEWWKSAAELMNVM